MPWGRKAPPRASPEDLELVEQPSNSFVSLCGLESLDRDQGLEREFGRPGRFGAALGGAAAVGPTVDAGGQPPTPSSAPEISANVVIDFPLLMRFLMSALAWLALCYHIYLTSRGCCAETALAWTPGTNGGFCTCAGLGVECDRYGSYPNNLCCMHGGCLRPVNETCQSCNWRGRNKVQGSCEKVQCPGTCTVIDASELELPARTPKSCKCCRPKTTLEGLYDEAGAQINWSFAVFVVMWYLSFATDINVHFITALIPCFFCCGESETEMQNFWTIWFGTHDQGRQEQAQFDETRMQTLMQKLCGKHNRGSLLTTLRRRGRQEPQEPRWRRRGRQEEAQEHTVVSAEGFTALTRRACDKEPSIYFYNECYHTVQRGIRTHAEITHRALERYATESDESSAPLFPARAGDGWEIPYLNASGESCIARSRAGWFELRVTLELCFENFEEQTEFGERFARFRMDNKHDSHQRNLVKTHISQARRHVYELEEGKTPAERQARAELDLRYFYLCSCLALGWLYQVWYTYDSLPTPVELHLRKTIRKKPLVAYWPAGIQMNQSPLARQPSEVRVIVETHDEAENENAKFRESVDDVILPPVNFKLSEPLGMGLNARAIVERVQAGGQAERESVAVGMRVHAVNGDTVHSLADVKARLAEAKGRGEAAAQLTLSCVVSTL